MKWTKQTLFPLMLMLACPPAIFLFWYTNAMLDGSFYQLAELMKQEGFWTTLYRICSPYLLGTPEGWQIVAVFAAFELALMKFLPGKSFYGPITPAGNTPVYKANGVAAYLTTLGVFYLCAFQFHLFSPSLIYDHFPGILGALNFFSLFFCLALLIKGHVKPSGTDSGSSGNWIFDYYWGMELYPRLLGIDLKMFTNCAFRDDQRCALKYGSDWKAYCEKVPYKLVPFVI